MPGPPTTTRVSVLGRRLGDASDVPPLRPRVQPTPPEGGPGPLAAALTLTLLTVPSRLKYLLRDHPHGLGRWPLSALSLSVCFLAPALEGRAVREGPPGGLPRPPQRGEQALPVLSAW